MQSAGVKTLNQNTFPHSNKKTPPHTEMGSSLPRLVFRVWLPKKTRPVVYVPWGGSKPAGVSSPLV